MPSYAYRLVNVFAESPLGGNPLCVFEDARGMSDELMQALALQFNLSETTFVLPSERGAQARVRIFTPGFEMAFAGHPTLGTAHVVRGLAGGGDALTLEFKAGLVPVRAEGDRWTLVPPVEGAPRAVPAGLSRDDIAAMLGLSADDLAGEPSWVNTGSDQLLVPLKTPDAVRRARPAGDKLDRWPVSSQGRRMAYVFAFTGAKRGGRDEVLARFFFSKNGGMDEDPGTGSACANLGGWLLAQGAPLPASVVVSQGEQVRRPCSLYLDVTPDGTIRVGGNVVALGRGEVSLP